MLLTGALSRPPSRSILESGAAAETGLITEAGAGRSAGADDAPGGGGRRSGLAPKPVPPGREGLSFFRSIFRLTLMVWPSLKAKSRLGLAGSLVTVSFVKLSSFFTWNNASSNFVRSFIDYSHNLNTCSVVLLCLVESKPETSCTHNTSYPLLSLDDRTNLFEVILQCHVQVEGVWPALEVKMSTLIYGQGLINALAGSKSPFEAQPLHMHPSCSTTITDKYLKLI